MRRGQANSEWMLLIAVLAVGLALAAYAFLPGFREGVKGLASDVDGLFAEGARNGTANMR
jgi:hypothetical protein